MLQITRSDQQNHLMLKAKKMSRPCADVLIFN